MSLESIAVFKWEQLARRQKIYIVAAAVLVVIAVGSSWVNTFRAWSETRVYEKAANEAGEQKEAALEQAAKIASQIQIRERELSSIEVRRDAKQNEVKTARDDVDRARREYERAVRQHDPEIPSTDELCRRLAAVGHPCAGR